MIEGMPQFVKGDINEGMMSNFTSRFVDKMDISEFVPKSTVGKNGTEKWTGVTFMFSLRARTGFLAASILIEGKVYYIHFTQMGNLYNRCSSNYRT